MEPWIYYEGADPDYEGFEGHLGLHADVDQIGQVIPDGERYEPEDDK